MKYIYLLIYLFVSISGLVLFKFGANNNLLFEHFGGNFNIKFNIFCIVGILLYLISFVLYLFLLTKFDLSYLIPFTTGLSQILVIVSSYFILGENISLYNVLGVFFIILGVFFISK